MSYSFMGDWSTPKFDLRFTLGALVHTALDVDMEWKSDYFVFGVDHQPNPFLTRGGIDHTASEPNMGLNFVSGAKIGTFLLQMVSWKRFWINENILSASIKKFPFEADKIFQMTLDLIQVYVYWSKILILASDTKKNLTRPSRTVCSANYRA